VKIDGGVVVILAAIRTVGDYDDAVSLDILDDHRTCFIIYATGAGTLKVPPRS